MLLLASVCVALLGCSPRQAELPLYAAELEVYLEPFDERDLCRLHVALRNTSGVRQGFSSFRIVPQANGSQLPELELRHNAMRVGMLRSARADLPLPCAEVDSLRIESATWEVFEGWDNPVPKEVRIDGADETDWNFDFDQERSVWVGERITG